MARVHIIQTTLGNHEDAVTVTRALLNARLAACIQTAGPIQSSYHWQGHIEHSEEWHLTIKTTASACPGVIRWLEAHHPYDTPEIIWSRQHCTDSYADWCQASVAPPEEDAAG